MDKLQAKLLCPSASCKSVVLRPGAAEKLYGFVPTPEFTLPLLPLPAPTATASTTDPSAPSPQVQQPSFLWRVADKMDFDNIAFSLTLPNGHRLLACADCEVGPIGFVDAASGTCFILPDRVRVVS
ncbi:hypothetical protein HK100_009833, partial [Physocladia obscura]